MIGIGLRLLLVAMAIITMVYFLRKIRKNRLQIEYAIFWSLFSVLLLILALFPQIAQWGADLIGIQAPINLMYLGIIFILIIQQFSLNVKLSKLESQLTNLAQHIAITQKDAQDEKTKANEVI